jgi:hypothetical protein
MVIKNIFFLVLELRFRKPGVIKIKEQEMSVQEKEAFAILQKNENSMPMKEDIRIKKMDVMVMKMKKEILVKLEEEMGMQLNSQEDEEDELQNITDFLQVIIKEEPVTIIGQMSGEVEEGGVTENPLQGSGEDKKKVKKEYPMPAEIKKLGDEEVVKIKKRLDNKTIKDFNRETFRSDLEQLIVKGRLKGVPRRFCLVCGKDTSTKQHARNHIEAWHVEGTKHQCEDCDKYYSSLASLEAHKHCCTSK